MVRPASPLSPVAAAASAAAGEGPGGCSSSGRGMDAVLLQAPGSFARMRSASGVLGGGVVAGGGVAVDAAAMQQLAAVRQAQASGYR
jgi:hypothetical protein